MFFKFFFGNIGGNIAIRYIKITQSPNLILMKSLDCGIVCGKYILQTNLKKDIVTLKNFWQFDKKINANVFSF